MRRKTVELDSGLAERARKSMKNKSYFWGKSLIKGISKNNKLIGPCRSSQTIITLFLQDLFTSLEPLFRQIDKKLFDSYLIGMITSIEGELTKTLNPIASSSLENRELMCPEEEPQTVGTDWICGGKVGHTAKRMASKHTISVLSTERKSQVGREVPKSKNLISSSKNLIKVAKEQYLCRKRSLQALKIGDEELTNRHEELMKEKMTKLTKQKIADILFKTTYNEKNSKFNSTLNNLQEFSYDYDGTAIPLRKIGHRMPDKVHVLNTLCKVNKDTSIPRIGRLLRGNPYNYLKTEADEVSKEKVIPQINKIGEARKESFLKSVNEIKLSSARGGDEQNQFRNKFTEFVRARAVKIRQLNN